MALQDEPTSPLVVVLTSKQDAFMLALRADVDERGMLHGNLLRKRVKIEPDYRPQSRGAIAQQVRGAFFSVSTSQYS